MDDVMLLNVYLVLVQKSNLSNKQGQSPLFAASKCGHCDVVKYLLSSGADINLHDEGCQSPLFVVTYC
jgi:ankyrin repeat protein